MARILIVEEDLDVRGLLEQGLAAEGHACVQARDGREGLLRLLEAHEAFDVLVVEQPDVGPSPGLLRAVAAALFGPVHLLVMTDGTRDEPEPMRDTAITGRVTVIGKPFLLSHLQDLVSARSASAAAGGPAAPGESEVATATATAGNARG